MAVGVLAAKTGTRAFKKAPVHALSINRVSYFTYKGPTSYTTGGEVQDFVANFSGLVPATPLYVEFIGNSTTIGYTATWNASNKKVQIWNGTSEFSSSGDASGVIFDVRVSCA